MLELKRGTNPEHFEPLTWRRLSDRGQDGFWVVMVKCGNSHLASLTDPDHVIDSEGVVTPSLICPTEDCDWHENVKLKEWEP